MTRGGSSGRAVADGVADQVGDDPLEQPGVGEHHRQVVGHVDHDARPGRAEVVQRQRHHLVEGDRRLTTDSAPACSRLMSSRLSTSRVSRSRDSSAVSSSSAWSWADHSMSVAAQARHGGLRRGQRGAQVVPDGGEQRRPHPVALGDRHRGGGGLAEPVPLQDDGGLRGEGADDSLVLGAQRPAAQREHQGVPGGDLGVGILRVACTRSVPATATTVHSSPGPRAAGPRPARGACVPFQQGDRGRGRTPRGPVPAGPAARSRRAGCCRPGCRASRPRPSPARPAGYVARPGRRPS